VLHHAGLQEAVWALVKLSLAYLTSDKG